MHKILLILLLILPMTSFAKSVWYECEVKQFYALNDDGELEARTEGYQGERFSVNRTKEIIVGGKINTLYNHDVVSSDPGQDGIYSLVNYSRRDNGQIRRLVTLTIQDFGPSKPFVLAQGNYIFSGSCQ
ncbi:MAG: hypothetical protein ACI845_003576 [Gammaproteobacteria bacterium]|jgi:hypothetical protein